MADIVINANQLRLEAAFVDGDTRTITIKNPLMTLTRSDIQNYSDFIAANNLLVGDKTGAAFGRITKGRIVLKTVTHLDLNVPN